MTALKWQRVADSDGTTIMYTAVAGQPEPRQPYLSYRITPVGSLHNVNRIAGYDISLWRGERELRDVHIGSHPSRTGRWGELTIAEAKRAAQQHHNTHNT